MGPMSDGRGGWCNPYSAPYGGNRPYNTRCSVPPVASYSYGRGRPRRGLSQGTWGRGRSWDLGRGRGRR